MSSKTKISRNREWNQEGRRTRQKGRETQKFKKNKKPQKTLKISEKRRGRLAEAVVGLETEVWSVKEGKFKKKRKKEKPKGSHRDPARSGGAALARRPRSGGAAVA